MIRYLATLIAVLLLASCGEARPEDVAGLAGPVQWSTSSTAPSTKPITRNRQPDSPSKPGDARVDDPGGSVDRPSIPDDAAPPEPGLSPTSAPRPAPDMSGCAGARNYRKPADGGWANHASLYRKQGDEPLYYIGWVEWKYQETSDCEGAQWLYLHPEGTIGTLYTRLTRTADDQSQLGTLSGVRAGETRAPAYIHAGDGSLVCAKLWSDTASYITKASANPNGQSGFCS